MGRGGGASTIVQAPSKWRGTSVQVCGLWPFSTGTGTPMVGVPLGRTFTSGATLCADPISWFQDAGLISNPSMFVLGRPGLGKSSLLKRIILGLSGFGVMPLVLGDLKPDYVDLIEALGGQVIRLGRGRGYLNVLDPGEARGAAERLQGSARSEVLADARARRQSMIATLITLSRTVAPSDREEMILDRALRLLDDRHDGIPVLGDLVRLISEAPEELRLVAMDRGDSGRYQDITEPLLVSLQGLLGQGRLGEIFSQQSSSPMRRDRPVVFDVSSIDDNEVALQGAALMACWSAGFGAVNIANALADAGLEPRRHYFVVLDELWRALRAGQGIVDRVDVLTRLNRQRGVGVAMCSHTMSDLQALASEQDRQKARGFVERSGMVALGGLPSAEMPQLTSVIPLSAAEQSMLVGWQDPAAWTTTGTGGAPPGRGNFLIKVGGRPGIPIHVGLTPTELALHDTNRLWHEHSRVQAAAEFAGGEQ
jgi:DNA helicase HerA-like ATPase